MKRLAWLKLENRSVWLICQYLLHFWQLVEGKNLVPSIIFWRLSYSSDKILPVSLVSMLVNCRGSPVNSLHLRVKLLSNNQRSPHNLFKCSGQQKASIFTKSQQFLLRWRSQIWCVAEGSQVKQQSCGEVALCDGTALELLLQRCPLCWCWCLGS